MSDDVIWQLIKNGFCSFRKTTDKKTFCTNIYNVTGLCNHASCPLANSNYSTVIEDQGDLLLCLKKVERCHLPREMWQKIKLSTNKSEAMKQINEHTKAGFSLHLARKCKLRYLRLKEVLRNMRSIVMKKQHLVLKPIKKKTERRELIREKKAEIASKLDKSIENELLNRLNQGIYGELYNFSTSDVNIEKETEEDKEYNLELENDIDKVDSEINKTKNKIIKKRRSKRLNIEYEKDEDYYTNEMILN